MTGTYSSIPQLSEQTRQRRDFTAAVPTDFNAATTDTTAATADFHRHAVQYHKATCQLGRGNGTSTRLGYGIVHTGNSLGTLRNAIGW